MNYRFLAVLLTVSLAIPFSPIAAQSMESLLQKGYAAQSLANYSDAEQVFQRILAQDPRNLDAHVHLANAFYNQGKLTQAIATYQKAIQIDPKNPYLYYNLGITLAEQGNLVEAIATYHQALEVDPQFTDAYYNITRCATKTKRTQEN